MKLLDIHGTVSHQWNAAFQEIRLMFPTRNISVLCSTKHFKIPAFTPIKDRHKFHDIGVPHDTYCVSGLQVSYWVCVLLCPASNWIILIFKWRISTKRLNTKIKTDCWQIWTGLSLGLSTPLDTSRNKIEILYQLYKTTTTKIQNKGCVFSIHLGPVIAKYF